ncbi:uncharacterized protein M6G45_001635 [Spheniscus humboldti]
MACFNFRRGSINPELFATSGFSRHHFREQSTAPRSWGWVAHEGARLAWMVSLRSPRADTAGLEFGNGPPLRPTCSSAPFLRPRRTYRESEEVFDHLLPTEAFVFHFANAPL